MFGWSNDGKPDYSTHLAVFQNLFREKNKKTAQNNVVFFKLPDQNTFHAFKIYFLKKQNSKKTFTKHKLFWSPSLCLLCFFFKFFFSWSSYVMIPPTVLLEGLILNWKAGSTVQLRTLHTIAYRSVGTGTVQLDSLSLSCASKWWKRLQLDAPKWPKEKKKKNI